ncbi:hypothetical protein ABIA39_003617 [Nocardia sp. GAS34]|uniref:hypothetical protein n=1 Tax=unclassified Nocardia TaxID=2637762 RepID=UPI003D249862
MSPESLERRVAALESRVGEAEAEFGETVWRIHREVIRTQITLAELAAHSGVVLACDDEVDDVLEARS